LRRSILLIPLMLILLLSACSVNKADRDALKLRTEMAKWNSFRLDGVVEVNFQGYSLRKFFVAQKNLDVIRLDVLDGGIAGMSAEPLLSFYKGDYLALRSPMMPQLEFLNLDKYFPQDAFRTFSNLDSLAAEHQEEILSTHSLSLNSIRMDFTPGYSIKSITDLKSGAKADFIYTSRGQIDKLELKVDEDASLILLIDDASFKPQVITPLERSANTIDLLKSITDKFGDILNKLPEKLDD